MILNYVEYINKKISAPWTRKCSMNLLEINADCDILLADAFSTVQPPRNICYLCYIVIKLTILCTCLYKFIYFYFKSLCIIISDPLHNLCALLAAIHVLFDRLHYTAFPLLVISFHCTVLLFSMKTRKTNIHYINNQALAPFLYLSLYVEMHLFASDDRRRFKNSDMTHSLHIPWPWARHWCCLRRSDGKWVELETLCLEIIFHFPTVLNRHSSVI